jgi:hypothetical protein
MERKKANVGYTGSGHTFDAKEKDKKKNL